MSVILNRGFVDGNINDIHILGRQLIASFQKCGLWKHHMLTQKPHAIKCKNMNPNLHTSVFNTASASNLGHFRGK